MISFREKSLWVSLLVTTVVAGIYGDTVVNLLFAGQDALVSEITSLMLRVVFVFVVLEIVLHAALSMKDQEGADQQEDEREQLFRLKANNVGYWVLSIGVVSCIIQQMLNANIGFEAQSAIANLSQARLELKMIVVFWLSEFIRFATELFYFRKNS